MFGSKCGKEIFDEAVICPNCGCPTNSTTNAPSKQYPLLKDFANQVKTPYIVSIVGIVLCLGIGFILAIVARVMCNNIVVPEFNSTNPSEIAEYEQAKRKLETAEKLSRITLGIFLIVLGVSIFFGCVLGGFIAADL